MSAIPRGNRDLIRSINRSIVLNVIKTQGLVSRAAIAQQTGLSPATVTAITSQLIKENLVLEKSTGDSTGGRPPIMLALNPRGGFVIGIKLMETQAVGVLTDLNAAVLVRESQALADQQLETAVDALTGLVNRLQRAAELRKKQLLGVGIGLAGVVDFSHGMVRQNPFFGWKNVPLRELLEARLRLPVYIDNDVNALTLSEKWLCSGQPEDNFILITVGRGIGMGIVLNGQIYRGNAGGAGEFGHLVVDPNGPLCDCGKRGCLESILSDRALVAAAQREVGPQVNSLDDLIRLAEAGQPAAVGILERVGRLLGQQMANLVNLLDPKLILVSGEGIRMGSLFFEPLRAAFREGVMSGLAEDTEIRVDSWGDDIWALGAASLVIAAMFNAPVQKEESASRKT